MVSKWLCWWKLVNTWHKTARSELESALYFIVYILFYVSLAAFHTPAVYSVHIIRIIFLYWHCQLNTAGLPQWAIVNFDFLFENSWSMLSRSQEADATFMANARIFRFLWSWYSGDIEKHYFCCWFFFPSLFLCNCFFFQSKYLRAMEWNNNV